MTTLSRSEATWILLFIFALVFMQGVTINLMPLILPTLGDVFEIDRSQQGFIRSSEAMGMLAALFLGGVIRQLIKSRLTGVFAVILMGAGAFGMAESRLYTHLLLAAFCMGAGTALILAVHSSVVSDFFYEGRQRMYLLIMAVFAVGAMVGPYLFGLTLEYAGTDGWRRVYFYLGILLWAMITAVCLIGWRRLGKLGRERQPAGGKSTTASEEDSPAAGEEPPTRLLVARVLKSGALYLLALIVIFDCLATWSAVTWMPTLAKEKYGVGESSVGLMMALLAAGVLLGRLLMAAFLAGRFSDRKLLGYSYAASMLMFVLALMASSFATFAVMWFLVGFFMSAQAATTYAVGSQKFKELAGIAIPMVDGIGMIGALIGPPLLGHLAELTGQGIHASLWLVPIFGLTLTAISLGWQWFDKKTERIDSDEDNGN